MSSRKIVRILAVASALGFLLAFAGESQAHRRRVPRRPPPPSFGPPSIGPGYSILKAGGYGVGNITDDTLDGLFVGLEAGVSPSPFVDAALTVDWFRRRSGTSDLFLIDTPYELPVEGELAIEGTSVDLVPMGALLRLKFPVSSGRLVPFVSGQLTYDVLHLGFEETTELGGYVTRVEQSDWVHGVGGTFAVGMIADVDPSLGFLFEAGYHASEPSQDFEIDGIPVDGRVDVGGGFARVGMRLGFR